MPETKKCIWLEQLDSHRRKVKACGEKGSFFAIWPQSSGKPRWALTSTSRSYGGRSSPMSCGFFSGCAAGSTASSLRCTGPPAPPGPIKRAGWDTRPSKVTSYIGFVCAAVAANAQFLRVQPMASLSITVLTS